MYCLYRVEKIPSIEIFEYQIWKIESRYFHLLADGADSMENSKIFRSDYTLWQASLRLL